MEYLDLVDENDNVIGKEERNLIYEKGYTNFRTVVIIVSSSDGKIIIPKRSLNRRIFPGCLDMSAAGHVDSGEDYETSAYRELFEELGIKDRSLEEIGYFKPQELDLGAFCKLYKIIYDGDISYDKDGIDEILYMTKNEIEKVINEGNMPVTNFFPKIYKWVFENNIL